MLHKKAYRLIASGQTVLDSAQRK